MVTKCILCEKDKKGEPVSDDLIIRSVRRLKKATNTAQNNKLVVCKDCMPEHLKRRANFEKWLVRHGALGAIVAIVFFLMNPSLQTLAFGIFIVLLMLVLSLAYYHPSLVKYPAQEKTKRAGK